MFLLRYRYQFSNNKLFINTFRIIYTYRRSRWEYGGVLSYYLRPYVFICQVLVPFTYLKVLFTVNQYFNKIDNCFTKYKLWLPSHTKLLITVITNDTLYWLTCDLLKVILFINHSCRHISGTYKKHDVIT